MTSGRACKFGFSACILAPFNFNFIAFQYHYQHVGSMHFRALVPLLISYDLRLLNSIMIDTRWHVFWGQLLVS
jgi:hypothetical protein